MSGLQIVFVVLVSLTLGLSQGEEYVIEVEESSGYRSNMGVGGGMGVGEEPPFEDLFPERIVLSFSLRDGMSDDVMSDAPRGSDVTLELKRNRHMHSDVRVFAGDVGGVISEKIPAENITFGVYTDRSKNASILAKDPVPAGMEVKHKFIGTFKHNDVIYEIQPEVTSSTRRRRRRSPRDLNPPMPVHIVSRVLLPVNDFYYDSIVEEKNLLAAQYLRFMGLPAMNPPPARNPAPARNPQTLPTREDRPVPPPIVSNPMRQERVVSDDSPALRLERPEGRGERGVYSGVRDTPYGWNPMGSPPTPAPAPPSPAASNPNPAASAPRASAVSDDGPWTSWPSERTDFMSSDPGMEPPPLLTFDLQPGSQVKVTYPVEVLIIVDYSAFQFWHSAGTDFNTTLEKIRQYYSLIINGVDMLLSTIQERDFGVYVRPVGIYVATSQEDASWVESARTYGFGRDRLVAAQALDNIQEFLSQRGRQLPDRDATVVFTRHNMVGNYDRSVLGMSTGRSVCTQYGVSLNKDTSVFMTTHTAVHQIAHMLGAQHDGRENSCAEEEGFLMSAQPRDNWRVTNLNRLSPCSVSEIRMFLGYLAGHPENCLTENQFIGNDQPGVNNVPFGQMYPPHEQCRQQYGWASFYCAGRTKDRLICETMECYNPASRQCVTALNTRAAEGTTCGQKKWCSNRQCVYSGRAPPAPETCIYGDYRGVFPGGLRCSDLPVREPWRCYDPRYQEECCVTCDSLRTEIQGCEFDDKSGSCDAVKPSECYNNRTRDMCCGTCARLSARMINPTPECLYGDKDDWCSTVVRTGHDCYGHAPTCCATCGMLRNPGDVYIQDCEYGDKATWCSDIHRHRCYNDSAICCQTCLMMRDDENTGCEYGNREAWCVSIEARDCYRDDIRRSCCATCQSLRANLGSGCEWGDRVANCTEGSCTTAAGTGADRRECCGTCAATLPGTPGPTPGVPTPTPGADQGSVTTTHSPLTPHQIAELLDNCPGDVDPMCSVLVQSSRDCYTHVQKCCSTCRQFYVPNIAWIKGGCEFGDREERCSRLQTGDCYHGNTSLMCCKTCEPNTADTYCPYGDREAQCDLVAHHKMHCYEPSIKKACCDTCRGDNSNPSCPHGDRDAGCTPADCDDINNHLRCCSTCAQHPTAPSTVTTTTSSPKSTTTSSVGDVTLHEVASACNTEDKDPACPSVLRHECYEASEICCQSCKKFNVAHLYGQSCRYGDYDPACVPQDCVNPDRMSRCCAMCANVNALPPMFSQLVVTDPTTTTSTTTTTTPTTTSTAVETTTQLQLAEKECVDAIGICSGLDCAVPATRKLCCATCSKVISTTTPVPTSAAECPVPDQSWCSSSVQKHTCYNVAHLCCSTCAKHHTGNTACPYGDAQLFCGQIEAYHCYSNNKTCCQTCQRLNSGFHGCEWGDRLPGCTVSDCADPDQRAVCCETCRRQEYGAPVEPTAIPQTTTMSTPTIDPSLRDNAPWCPGMAKHDCYVSAHTCPKTCAEYTKHHLPERCKYGDMNSWCAKIPDSDCRYQTTRNRCCEKCSNLASQVQTTTLSSIQELDASGACAHGSRDKAKWCLTMGAHDCYTSRKSCCATCRRFYTHVQGCEYGDRNSWCASYVRRNPRTCMTSNIAISCCASCARRHSSLNRVGQLQDETTPTTTPTTTTETTTTSTTATTSSTTMSTTTSTTTTTTASTAPTTPFTPTTLSAVLNNGPDLKQGACSAPWCKGPHFTAAWCNSREVQRVCGCVCPSQ